MKKLFLLLLPGMLSLAGEAEAQFQKGTTHWGATISAEGSIADAENFTGIDSESGSHTISPSVQFGHFFKENTMFGIKLTPSFNLGKYNLSGQDFEYNSKSNYMTVNISPFVRRYKFLGEKWAIFLQTGLNLAYVRTKTSNQETTTENGYGIGAYVAPGLVYRISSRFALESDLNLLSLNAGYTKIDDWHNVYFSAGATSSIQSYFGLRASWYLTQSK